MYAYWYTGTELCEQYWEYINTTQEKGECKKCFPSKMPMIFDNGKKKEYVMRFGEWDCWHIGKVTTTGNFVTMNQKKFSHLKLTKS